MMTTMTTDDEKDLNTSSEPPHPSEPILLDGVDDDDDDEDDNVNRQQEQGSDVQMYASSSPSLQGVSPTTSQQLLKTLISTILTPSPFPHHNDTTSSTADRYRSALQRITASPTNDDEAWSAIMNECMTLYRTQLLPELQEERMNQIALLSSTIQQQQNSQGFTSLTLLQSLPKRKDILESKLDWVESCHGHLLKYFPYASNYYTSAIEILLAKSALLYESYTGGEDNYDFLSSFATTGNTNITLSDFVKYTPSPKQTRCEELMEYIFQTILGVNMDGSRYSTTPETTDTNDSHPLDENVLGGMCTSSVDLWLLYIRKRSRDAKRKAFELYSLPLSSSPSLVTPTSSSTITPNITPDGENLIREWTINAYETALSNGASFALNNHLVWKQYLAYVKSWNITTMSTPMNDTTPAIPTINPILQNQQKQLLRSIYQRIIALPMLGLDGLWHEYESFEKGLSEQLASALIADNMPKYQHARSVYLERNRVVLSNLQELRIGRLATPPVDLEFAAKLSEDEYNDDDFDVSLDQYEDGYENETDRFIRLMNSSNASSSTNIGTSKVSSSTGAAGTTTGAASSSNVDSTGDVIQQEEYQSKMMEEMKLITKWKQRCGYERTNPERLSPTDLTIRIRQCYKDTICVLMRHVEVWHEWCMWELLNTGGNDTTTSSSSLSKKQNIKFSVAVLELAQKHLPDSALLAYTHAQVIEHHSFSIPSKNITSTHSNNVGDAAIKVMQDFCNRAGNSLGYVLLQRLVRKYKGMKEAREVFAKARRSLRLRRMDRIDIGFGGNRSLSSGGKENPNSGNDMDERNGISNANKISSRLIDATLGDNRRELVMNRSSYNDQSFAFDLQNNNNYHSGKNIDTENESKTVPKGQHRTRAGYITWHLFASHANMEHRINRSPRIAARVFELGLKRHRSFLSSPEYIMQYSSLLLELNDDENLRSLLMRAIAACEEENSALKDDTKALARKRATQKPIWDMILRVETILSTRSGDLSALQNIENRRRMALYGPNNEDVVGVDFFRGEESEVGIGVQKSSLGDTIIRTDGYDVSSRIANGLSRMVDFLDANGILGSEGFDSSVINASTISPGIIWKDDKASGKSDSSYRRRLRFQKDVATVSGFTESSYQFGIGGVSRSSYAVGVPGSTAGKYLSAKERLAQSASQNAMAAASIQSSPEWLRGLLLLLPATARMKVGAKAPPHLIEMALAALRGNNLPAERPVDVSTSEKLEPNKTAVKRPRGLMENNGDGDSSDEENGNSYGGGYGSQFRARQRARMMGNDVDDTGSSLAF